MVQTYYASMKCRYVLCVSRGNLTLNTLQVADAVPLFKVVDVFTAVALAGIFSTLIKKGTIIIATSNRAPDDLNKVWMKFLYL